MHTFLTTLLDIVLPYSPEGRLIRPETTETIQRVYLPHRHQAHVALSGYREPLVRALIMENKFQGNRHASDLLAALLARHLRTLSPPVTIIPIPLSRNRFRTRGYNQVTTITDALAQHLDTVRVSVLPALRRTRDTTPQTSITQEDRSTNVRDAFALRGRAGVLPTAGTIIILDDVVTTGATLTAAGAALKPHLAKNVALYTLALAH